MKKSIYSKLISTNILLISISIVLIMSLIAIIMTLNTYSREKKRLEIMADKTESLYTTMENQLIGQTKLQHYIDAMGYVTQSKIYLLNVTKETLTTLKNSELSQTDLQNYLYDDLSIILEGNQVFRKSQYSEAFNGDMLFYGRPLYSSTDIIGAIIIFSPNQSLKNDIGTLLLITIFSGLLTIMIALILLFINAQSIRRPVNEVKDAVLNLANGELSTALPHTTYVELMDLVDAFEYMKRELLRLEEDKKEFLVTMSHELKTPLTVITGYLEAIQDGIVSPEELDESLKVIYCESIRLTNLTKEIITQTNSKTYTNFIKPELINLHDLLNETKSLMISTLKKEIHIHIQCDPNLVFYADPDKMRQIIHNLTSNSIKYSSSTVTINLNGYTTEECLTIEVIDDGFGIKKEYLNQVFQRYYRIKNEVNTDEGNGLGLNITKRLVELHKGTIKIESEFRKGTKVTIEFPPFY